MTALADVDLGGRHRRRSRYRVATQLSLCAALVAAVALLAGSPPQRAAPVTNANAAAALASLEQTWPTARVHQVAGLLSDRTEYSALFYLDAQTAIGSAPTLDRTAVRILLRSAAAAPRELQQVPTALNPQFAGFTVAGDEVVWSVSTVDAGGRAETRLWRANWRTGAPAVAVTADTGDAVFFNSQYDMVVAGGRVHWAAAARNDNPVTEVRSVPLSGGAVTVRQVPGAYSLSAWPWLVSAGSGQAGPVDLLNLDTNQRLRVAAAATELVTCSPVWCRVLVLTGGGGPARFDLMHPDTSQRQRVAGGTASASIADVALLDRFEVLSQNSSQGSATSSQQLMLYDLRKQRTVLVSKGVGTVLANGGMLWWSTGDNEAQVWNALDLRTLA